MKEDVSATDLSERPPIVEKRGEKHWVTNARYALCMVDGDGTKPIITYPLVN